MQGSRVQVSRLEGAGRRVQGYSDWWQFGTHLRSQLRGMVGDHSVLKAGSSW